MTTLGFSLRGSTLGNQLPPIFTVVDCTRGCEHLQFVCEPSICIIDRLPVLSICTIFAPFVMNFFSTSDPPLNLGLSPVELSPQYRCLRAHSRT
ncbi:expressed protein [Echinococcus multilocularis]|uniref:Expressed protein n=1 Tax=Echinococcus multilocularis TaxID=6211 RepID=A0A068Y882_ECHMU|nr:expressed protein [Echinococcus multilocularis]